MNPLQNSPVQELVFPGLRTSLRGRIIMSNTLSPLLAAAVAALCCLPQPAGAQTPRTLAGTWFGSIVITNANATVTHDTAVLVIDPAGPGISGSMGRTIDQLTPWSDGSFTNHQLQFRFNAAGGLNVSLTLHAGRLEGAATGQNMKAQLDLKPAPGLLPHQQLQQEILDADRELYKAFDKCDVAAYASFLSKDLEFYQDHTGKSGYEDNLKAVQNRCAEGIHLRRELEPDSVIVNAAPGFGAIQAGIQRFYSRGKNGQEHLDATARFTNVWSKQSGAWKLVRIISYDHR